MKIKFFTILSFVFLSQIGFSQEIDKDKLDHYFDTLEENNKFMGNVAVSQNGELIYTNTIGFSDIKNNQKADVKTKYRIGSISKTFTSVLVLKAVEEHKLKLNQTLEKDFPKLENAEKITIQHLLMHRSGIPNITSDKDYLNWNTQAKTENELTDLISESGSDFEPDSKAEYSNSNFVLLTFILEKTFQKSYAELLQAYIIKPLELENTKFGGPINTTENESLSYHFDGQDWTLEDETDMSIPLGAGSIVSTASDLVKFSDALFNGKLLKEESLDLMQTTKDNFGMGLFETPFYNKKGYGHTGGIDGFTSTFSHFSDGEISYALVSNASTYNLNNISIAVLSAVYQQSYDIPEFSTYKINPEDLDDYLGVYASKEIPLKITVSKENNSLVAQATGQNAFPLEATQKDKFKFEQAGVVIEFQPAENTLILIQGGGQYKFTKE